jgi:glucose/arabinose dehydrogenase
MSKRLPTFRQADSIAKVRDDRRLPAIGGVFGSRPRATARERYAGIFAVILVLGALGACSAGRTPPAAVTSPGTSGVVEPTNFSRGPADSASSGDELVSVTTLATGLDIPWGVTFLPDGGALVTERRTARILKVGPQRQPNGELEVTTVDTIQAAGGDTEGGLLGIAASPNFGRDQTVFVYYTTEADNRIAKLRLGQAPTPIVTGIPRAGIHDGGRLAFGPDGYLYATTGDATKGETAQRIDDLGGKILRMTTDGQPAPGNPFDDSLVWSYGHRNPEGIAWDQKGNMYAAEIGEAQWDELNVVQPGKNYGWPKVEGMGSDPSYVNPLVAWHPEVGVSADVAIVGETAVVTCLRGQRIYLVSLNDAVASGIDSAQIEGGGNDSPNVRWRPDAGVAGRPIEALTGKYGRLRTAINAPDGSIWLTTSNRDGRNERGPAPEDDRILRLTPRTPATPGGR